MTTPEQAAATARDPTNQIVVPASFYDTAALPDYPHPVPVPMGDPIADVTKRQDTAI